MKNKNKFWILIGIGIAVIALLMLLSSVLEVGERLRKINQYLEYGFYVLAFLILYFLILNPIRIILKAPSFSIEAVLQADSKKKQRIASRVTKNLLKQELPDQEKEKLRLALQSPETMPTALSEYFQKTLRPEIHQIILRNAKSVLLSTAISQNGRLDMLAVISVNLKMIKEVVLKCGFRPSYTRLGKLSVNVFSTAMIADGLEGLDYYDLFPTSTANFLSEIPLLKPFTASIIQGIANALLTIRIGIITYNYLVSETRDKTKLRMNAIKESIKILPVVLKETLSFLPKRIARIFTKKEAKPENA
ncbi:MAG: DUF697 domain-containing protein [Acholeplasmataceae bacterium]|nr:DUF697 domain-containing protein [Acholeplasmataceae bacterium]